MFTKSALYDIMHTIGESIMNMNLPPIDELEAKMGNKYKLSGVVAKRAKE